MLNLSRHVGETIVLQTEREQITIYLDTDGKQLKVAIDAPKSVEVVSEKSVRPLNSYALRANEIYF